jgi:hypothetical protein
VGTGTFGFEITGGKYRDRHGRMTIKPTSSTCAGGELSTIRLVFQDAEFW